MGNFKSIDEVLDFAIKAEQDAVDFYNQLAENAKTVDMRFVFTSFAQEEIKHKARLTQIKKEGSFKIEAKKIADLKISDYMAEVKATPNMTYSEALLVAMSNEKAAFKLYYELAKQAEDEEMRDVFVSLAQEESRHKLRFEIEYDEYVLREN
ncbi:MAG: ferritin family protein [Bacteroidales bacterium]|jgi:rubrerythrin|nr:ferritin family protein [Bacteroidales bacterium]